MPMVWANTWGHVGVWELHWCWAILTGVACVDTQGHGHIKASYNQRSPLSPWSYPSQGLMLMAQVTTRDHERAGPSGLDTRDLVLYLTDMSMGRAGPDPQQPWENVTITTTSNRWPGLSPYHACMRVALMVWVLENWPCSLPTGGWPWWKPALTNSATTQAHIRGFELSHPNMFTIYNFMMPVKGLVLWDHNIRISITQVNSSLSENKFNEGSVIDSVPEVKALEPDQQLIVRKLRQVKRFGQKCVLHDTARFPRPSQQINVMEKQERKRSKCFCLVLVVVFCFSF